MKLFDEIERTKIDFIEQDESTFEYLNRSSRREINQIRDLMEFWFSHYPTQHQNEFKGKYRSNKDRHHFAAFFELFIHELLLRLNCQIELHPKLTNRSATPDFFVRSNKGECFYLEATVASTIPKTEMGGISRINSLIYYLNKNVKSEKYFIWINLDGFPENPVPAKNIARFLSEKIKTLEINLPSTSSKTDHLIKYPKWQYTQSNWTIHFEPVIKTNKRPGQQLILGQNMGARWVDHRTPIREAIVKKSRKYGELEYPLIIALNALGPMIDEIDIGEALFGKESFVISINPDTVQDSVETKLVRKLDGAWTSPSGPRYKRVSAVLLANNLSDTNIPRAELILIHNPWAKKQFHSVLTRLPQVIHRDNEMTKIDCESIGEIFELPNIWPESE
jgi:hypothetical protein